MLTGRSEGVAVSAPGRRGPRRGGSSPNSFLAAPGPGPRDRTHFRPGRQTPRRYIPVSITL